MDITIRLPFGRRKLLAVLAVISVFIVLIVLFWPKKTVSQTEYEYLQQQLDNIKNYTAIVKEENGRETDKAIMLNNIEAYQEALLEALATCEQIENRVATADKLALQPFENTITQVQLFCRDYEDVVDYARKVSRATRQFISYPSESIKAGPSGVTDLQEILSYTRTDLEKLKSYPLQDPALEEMITSINNLQKQAKKAVNNPSTESSDLLAINADKQKVDFITARNYFWNNTIRLNSMERSIDRLQKLFEENNQE